MAETFYSALGVDPEADTETIQAAYRELVKTHHPDVSDEDDAATQFKRITQARDILCDESSRKQYDRVGHNTYVRRYMDGNAWTVEYGSGSGTSTTDSTSTSNTGRTTNSNWSSGRTNESKTGNQSGGGKGSRSQRGTGGSQRTGESGTAHDYDRYRSHYAGDETYQSGQSQTGWQDRSWTDDFESSPDDASTASTESSTSNSHEQARADGWQAAQAAASGYRPSGRESSGAGTGSSSSSGTIQPALRDVGPWLAFHFVFLVSAFVTILLLINWETTFVTVFISLILLGGAVFFSVLHMISRLYS